MPIGVRLIGERHPEIVPWGWGLNGAASVLEIRSSRSWLAMNLGFRAALGLAAACYVLAFLAGRTEAGACSRRRTRRSRARRRLTRLLLRRS